MNKMINCKSCNAEIAASAKVCPACGAKNKKPFYKKWWVWVIAVIFVSAIASSGGTDEPVKVKKGEEVSSTAKEETIIEIGDTVTTDKFEICINSVTTKDVVGIQYAEEYPSEGGVFVVVEWTCKNISNKPVSSFSIPTVKLVDADKVIYDSDVNATVSYSLEAQNDRKVLSDLNPGISVRDSLVFEISREAYETGGFNVQIKADKQLNVKIN